MAMMLRPPLERAAPRTKSTWPPTPENCLAPMASAATWPIRSTEMAELTLTMLSFWAMTKGSLVKVAGYISIMELSDSHW